MLLFLLLILVAAIVANVQLHKWQRQRRLDARTPAKTRKRAAPREPAVAETDPDEIDWEELDLEAFDLVPPAPAPARRPELKPVKTEPPADRPAAKPKAEPKGDFSPLEHALPQGRLTAAQRDEAMAQLLKASLHIPAPGPGERHVVLDMDDGSYVPVATHPAAASIALGYLAERMQPCQGAQLLRELRGSKVGLLVVARNPQKPSVARLWKIQPEDL
ncbi:hypothetical protein [Pseudomonas schmalbachii]|uniref:Uncharacterized protein n=1 Tax=Pseudomonas schmalbachii TaxID=2816993 RepID=A0ABS3TPK0_9PSED|nr:hypothetical protein [Pseudomonas schmalbachii]MBO3275098.1 hypothetical protein [Pseudomonas schmalbachii]